MILVVVGTRPELLKMAPVVKLAKARGLPVHVHCTMQSPDLVDRGIQAWDSEGDIARWAPVGEDKDYFQLGSFPKVVSFHRSQISFVAVQGDTKTAMSAALAAFETDVPVFHVEAGVRTYDLSAPWPEEGYRQMISRIARWHACTTWHNANNLRCENTDGTTQVHAAGPVLRDVQMGHPDYPTTAIHRGYIRVTGSPVVESVRERTTFQPRGPKNLLLLTLHRRENRGHFGAILEGVRDGAKGHGLVSLWPAHPNSWAEQELPRPELAAGMPVPCDPLDAEQFANCLGAAALVVTDSGGVQEESHVLKVPCCVVRTVTDRPESLGDGGARLAGNTREGVAAAIRECLTIDRSTISGTAFGDGLASERIVSWWQEILAQ